MELFKRIEWRLYKEIKRMKLKNKSASIIASNCNGTFIYYDMKLKYLSPTINLSFDMNDFVKMLEDLKWYMNLDVVPYEDKRFDYPTGMIGDIEIKFNHYNSFDEAVNKWNERKERINYDNLFVLGVETDGCTYETLKKFDQLPYKNKVIFTHKSYPEFKSAYYIKGFEENNEVGVLINFKNQFFIRRYLDDFDYVSFLNND